jgi:hypothetical protein
MSTFQNCVEDGRKDACLPRASCLFPQHHRALSRAAGCLRDRCRHCRRSGRTDRLWRTPRRTQRYWAVTIVGYVLNLLAVPLLALAASWEVAAALIIIERMGRGIRSSRARCHAFSRGEPYRAGLGIWAARGDGPDRSNPGPTSGQRRALSAVRIFPRFCAAADLALQLLAVPLLLFVMAKAMRRGGRASGSH